jgi:hypothetical protein
MKLPLFVSATPAASLVSPSVLIGNGKWRLRSNHTSSDFELRSKCHTVIVPISDGKEFSVSDGPLHFTAHTLQMGREPSITITVESFK